MPGHSADGAVVIRVLALAVMAAGPAAAGSLTVEPGQATAQMTPAEFRAQRLTAGTASSVAEIRAAQGGVRVVQSGRGHTAQVTTQAGNTGLVVQTGAGHSASLTQTGTGQAMVLIQTGTGAEAELVQATDGEKLIVLQHGWDPRH